MFLEITISYSLNFDCHRLWEKSALVFNELLLLFSAVQIPLLSAELGVSRGIATQLFKKQSLMKKAHIFSYQSSFWNPLCCHRKKGKEREKKRCLQKAIKHTLIIKGFSSGAKHTRTYVKYAAAGSSSSPFLRLLWKKKNLVNLSNKVQFYLRKRWLVVKPYSFRYYLWHSINGEVNGVHSGPKYKFNLTYHRCIL